MSASIPQDGLPVAIVVRGVGYTGRLNMMTYKEPPILHDL
jgi:hypothetical protein